MTQQDRDGNRLGVDSIEESKIGRLTTKNLRWLAGGLQVGGSVRFDSDGSNPYPVLKIGDNNQARIDKITEKFGGYRTHAKGRNTHYWVVAREDAAHLGGLIEPFSPLHKDMIGAFKNWEATDDPEKRKIIAQGIPLSDHRNLTSNAYEELITYPEYRAGIYDIRGRKGQFKHSDGRGGGWYIPEVHVYSRNYVILKDLEAKFNGRFRIRGFSRSKAGTEEPDLNEYNSFILILGLRNARTLFSGIREYVILRADEINEVVNWRPSENRF